MSVRILQGDCREVMRTLPEASVDAIVTDPPYELGFMGKGWDRTGVANDPETWRQALRVLKPGGHLLAFSGTRTYHRMVCAIEDAGFEVRDQIGWVYGSGFPKSLDVSKAIDKARHAHDDVRRATAWIAQHATARALDDAAGTNGMGGHWTTQGTQAAVPTLEAWQRIAHLLPSPPEWFVPLLQPARKPGEAWQTAEVLAEIEHVQGGGSALELRAGERREVLTQIKAANSEAARQWQGWGTALKPAWEPIVVARKPLIGTVATNVLAHGTGALNIDACRVEGAGPSGLKPYVRGTTPEVYALGMAKEGREVTYTDHPLGRWPANIIHDGSDEVLAAFPHTTSGKQAAGGHVRNVDKTRNAYGAFVGQRCEGNVLYGDTGSAARFFYTAKADGRDRSDGLQTVSGGAKNHHPTVKPTDLMRWLCRLVTPPGGTVLDPFMGSGSTLKAAELEGFSAVGIELDPAYIEIARRRIAADAPLFAEVA